MNRGQVFDIKRYAIHDGPGIRTTVFFKGCPLSCPWCHNPEGIPREPRIIHNPGACIRCGTCIPGCPDSALSMEEEGVCIDRTKCTLCLSCVEACPTNALEAVGVDYSVDDLMDEIKKDIPFFKTSGGGVTFSGGEPLMQPAFLAELLRECGKEGIHRAVDTSGYCESEILREIAGETDLFLYDLKLMDPDRHRSWTGRDNTTILTNLRMLVDHGCSLEVRVPLIPGINDDPDNLDTLGTFLERLGGITRVCILPYHDFQAGKYQRLNREYTLPGVLPPGSDIIEDTRLLLEQYNLEVKTGG